MSTTEKWLKLCRKAVEEGHSHAVIEAIDFCERQRVPVPPWLSVAVRKLIESPQAVGRGQSKPLNRYRKDCIDSWRYDEVIACRQMGLRWIDVYGAAAMILEGTIAEGSEESIRDSYKRFRRRFKKDPSRYLLCLPIVQELQIAEPRPWVKTDSAIWEEILSLAAKGKPPPLIQAQLKKK